MKFSVQNKKSKLALAKVSKKAKAEPAIQFKEHNKLALLESAREDLKTPQKAKLDGAIKKLKKTKNQELLSSNKSSIKREPKSPSKGKSKENLENASFEKSTTPKLNNSKPKAKSALRKNQSVATKKPVENKKSSIENKSSKKRKIKGENGVEGAPVLDLNVKEAVKVQQNKGKRKPQVVNKNSKKKSTSEAEIENDVTVSKEKTKSSVSKDGITSTQNLNRSLIESASGAILKLLSQRKKDVSKKDLFAGQNEDISLQIDCFKVPITAYRILRWKVPHSVYDSAPEVCLIAPDFTRGIKRDITFAKHADMFDELLSDAKISAVKQIIPFSQLRSEYSQFEMKRRLSSMYDVFLCDGRIQDHVCHFLGSIFENSKKLPIPVHAFKKIGNKLHFQKNVQDAVKQALHKVILPVHGKGHVFSLRIGHSGMSAAELADNVQSVWSHLSKDFPGGHVNIRTLYLKGAKSLPVPLYTSLADPSSVETPVVEGISGKIEPVEDELSTHPGRRVTVYPDGTVVVKDEPTEEDKEFLKSDGPKVKKSRKRDLSPKETQGIKKMKKSGDTEEKSDAENSDDEFGDVDAAENAYLTQWSESTALEDLKTEEKSTKKKKKAVGISHNLSANAKNKTKKKKIDNKKKIKGNKGTKKSPASGKKSKKMS